MANPSIAFKEFPFKNSYECRYLLKFRIWNSPTKPPQFLTKHASRWMCWKVCLQISVKNFTSFSWYSEHRGGLTTYVSLQKFGKFDWIIRNVMSKLMKHFLFLNGLRRNGSLEKLIMQNPPNDYRLTITMIIIFTVFWTSAYLEREKKETK